MTTELRRQPSNRFKQIWFAKYRMYTESAVPYDDYIHSEVWHEIRANRLKKDNYRCVKCGTGKNVEVHHIKYPVLAWGTEDIEHDIVTLCAKCHAEVHKFDIRKGDN